MEKDTWDNQKQEHIEMPKKMKEFLEEIEAVCKKHDLSISHEDGHGGFIIEEFEEGNIRWLKNAIKGYTEESPFKDMF